MKKSLISNGAVLTVSSALCLLFPSQTQAPANHESYRKESFSEEQQGKSMKVSLSAIPAKMRFPLVRPTSGFGLTQAGVEWWKCPKTNRRPAYAVAVTTYKDAKYAGGQEIVIEWKHVPGISADYSSGIPEGRIDPRTPLGWQSSIFPLVGTSQGTDVAIYGSKVPNGRLKEMTQWLTVDPQSLSWLDAMPDENTRVSGDPNLDEMQRKANINARALATCVQGNAISNNKYDTKLADYAADLGGSIPINPCTGTSTGYMIIARDTTATVCAKPGTHCGKWMPLVFSLTL
jgi:hypothetical protein